MARICWGRSRRCFIYNFGIQEISEKTLCRKGFTTNLRDIFIWKRERLVTRSIFVFCLYWVALYSKALRNSINFYKGIFLHVIPVRIIVPWAIQICQKQDSISSPLSKKNTITFCTIWAVFGRKLGGVINQRVRSVRFTFRVRLQANSGKLPVKKIGANTFQFCGYSSQRIFKPTFLKKN